jgi:DNA-binding NarL/FixJ family response regulator
MLTAADDNRATPGPLSEREVEILGMLLRGLANKQVAAQLGISEHTVKFHVSSIYTKLNVSNRTEAVREGLRNGWIAL